MKKGSILRILAVAFILALLIAAVPAAPAQAQTIYCSPTSGNIGTTVTLNGAGLNPATYPIAYIFFDSTYVASASVYVDGTFTTYFAVPSYTTSGQHYVTARDSSTYVGSTQLAITLFTVTARQITISPTSGYVGSTVTVSGTGFTANSNITITFHDISVGTTSTDSNGSFTSTTFTVPENYRGSHTVKATDASNYYAVSSFTIMQSITITPTSGVAGDGVTVTGTGFRASRSITITYNAVEVATSPTTVTTDTDGSFSASFSVPAGGSATYVVEASDGTYKDSADFTVEASVSLSQASGYVGAEVTVSGTGFNANASITITFGGNVVTTSPATVTSNANGGFSASFNVPASATATYIVSVSDGVNTKEANFDVLTSASISPVTSATSPGHVGTEVTISGIGFTIGGSVTIKYDGTQVAVATADSSGAFSATFTVSKSEHGEHIISVSDGINTKQLTFFMEAEAPSIPRPLKPEMGIKAESETYFDWQDVTDPSGVTYTLQIASDNFSTIVLEKTGLTESEYTITKEERLESVSRDEPYYWHVKAIDGASNESGWSGAGSFYLGFSFRLPQWVIYTLFGVGALILGGVGFWAGRKTAFY